MWGWLLLIVWGSRYGEAKRERMKLPKFKSLKEEREFWDTHDSTEYHDDFKTARDVVFVRPKKEVISLRLDPKIIRRLKELADKEGLAPTTYARMLIVKSIQARTTQDQ
jgi:predicted DNA binding CopG/RHH family protein